MRYGSGEDLLRHEREVGPEKGLWVDVDECLGRRECGFGKDDEGRVEQ